MFPFWDVALHPVLQAIQARRIVEIGALSGENTEQMLAALPADAELHVIDPLPQFDPEEHRQRFGGRYIFHRDLSLNVLSKLPPMDAAFIDGDHNWFTVYNEVKQLAEVTEAAGQPLPVLLLHDTLWPYGRRDLYYNPDTVPEEFRQPWQRMGLRPTSKGLAKNGGLNPKMANAEQAGGPRNGVMTGLEDALAEYPHPVRKIDLPVYFGLTIVADERTLAANAELSALLDHLESADGRHDLLEMIESVRLRAAISRQGSHYKVQDQLDHAAERYLSLLRRSLLNQHYLENELRMSYLVDRIEKNLAIDEQTLRDPRRYQQGKWRELESERNGDRAVPAGSLAGSGSAWFPYAGSAQQLDTLHDVLGLLATDHLRGDLVDAGIGRGGLSVYMRGYLDAHEVAARDVWVVDRFRADEAEGAETPDLNQIRETFASFDLLDDRVRFLAGEPAASLAAADIAEVAVLRVAWPDAADVTATLQALYRFVTHDGVVIIDAPTAAAAAAAAAFRADYGIDAPMQMLGDNRFAWRKTTAVEVEAVDGPGARRAQLVPKVETDTVDLSVVVVLYNMRREAQRTLHSMTRGYQRGLEDITYEVLVVDNGSKPEQRLSSAEVAAFGPEFRLIEMGDDAKPSPVTALVRATNESVGENVLLMIDGAHVLTPGVFVHGLRGLRAYAPAVVATQHWYVGPGQQNDAMLEGYDQTFEDQLFEQIAWPEDGYKLFDIGSFIGDRDWFDGMWESNCLFAPRKVLEQVGGFDESFDAAGGGYANLDLYEKLGAHAGVTLVSLLGEGSFHQTHGGTTTNQAEITERGRRLIEYREHYAELRGRPFRGPGKPIHYVGSFWGSSRRTKPRRLNSPHFAKAAAKLDRTIPMPDEIKTGFIETFFNTGGWRETTWLGHTVERAPTDLLAYQEMLEKVRPDVVVVANQGADGGLPQVLALMLEAIGHGRVLVVSGADAPDTEHERITRIKGRPQDPAVAEQVIADVGTGSGLLIIGRGRQFPLVRIFDAYQAIVPQGSYVVVEDTVVNGNPVLVDFGQGPHEASQGMMRRNGDFMVDPHLERFGLTFNVKGFLLRRTVETRTRS